MNVLLLCGLGPTFRNKPLLRGSFLELGGVQTGRAFPAGLSAGDFKVRQGRRPVPLLRPRRRRAPSLSAATLSGVLTRSGWEHEVFPLEHLWAGDREPNSARVDVVALSTTFICSASTLDRALRWIEQRFGGAPVIVGGQYSNLKADEILRRYPSLAHVIRGDGEVALPALLRAFAGEAALGEVPNLVFRDASGSVRRTPEANIDLDAYPAPTFDGDCLEVPYESMRGCPFSCKFCSYPAASPRWRWKSAATILRDWHDYAVRNNSARIDAMDSTFTVPPARFRELLAALGGTSLAWTAYARANDVSTRQDAERLVAAGCVGLSIGFESMSDATLGAMNKRTTPEHNRTAAALLDEAHVDLNASFIIGYPGEDERAYEQTRRYLLEEFRGRYLLNTFSLIDETLPVWREADTYRLRILDPQAPNHTWAHCGMDADTAHRLYEETVRDVRWGNDHAVLSLWQSQFEMPLLRNRSLDDNRRTEKLLERLAFAEVDAGDDHALATDRIQAALTGLADIGVVIAGAQTR